MTSPTTPEPPKTPAPLRAATALGNEDAFYRDRLAMGRRRQAKRLITRNAKGEPLAEAERIVELPWWYERVSPRTARVDIGFGGGENAVLIGIPGYLATVAQEKAAEALNAATAKLHAVRAATSTPDPAALEAAERAVAEAEKVLEVERTRFILSSIRSVPAARLRFEVETPLRGNTYDVGASVPQPAELAGCPPSDITLYLYDVLPPGFIRVQYAEAMALLVETTPYDHHVQEGVPPS